MSQSTASGNFSLSMNMRRQAQRQFNGNSSTTRGSRLGGGQSVVSRSLPSIATKASLSTESILDFPSRRGDPFARLSGLADPQNSTGLFAERSLATKPTSLCVRCGTMHSSICIACSELVCENTLTFYRKTRAAGAAALFTKAFVEAGNSKLVKFFIFRLLRNSFEVRKKQQMKMKNVVNKFFGTNTVYIPFSAWRRYTRQNITERKNRTIEALEEKVRVLEIHNRKLTTENASLSEEVKQLHFTARHSTAQIMDYQTEITHLREGKKKDRERILGLCNLAQPLQCFSTTIDDTLKHETADMRHYLNYAVTSIEGHNYANIFQETVLTDLQTAQREFELKNRPKKANPALAISTQVLVDWFTYVSRSASNLVDPMENLSLDRFLPAPDVIHSIKDFRTGKDLIRVIVALIWEYHRKEKNSMSTHLYAEDEHRRKSAQALQLLTYDNLHEIHKVKDSPIPLVTLVLHYTTEIFSIPRFKPLDIVAGKADVIFSLLTSLMNACKPLVNVQEYQEMGRLIGEYNDVSGDLLDLSTAKSTLTHFEDLITMWARYHDLDPRTGLPLPEPEPETEPETEPELLSEEAQLDADGQDGLKGRPESGDGHEPPSSDETQSTAGAVAATASKSGVVSRPGSKQQQQRKKRNEQEQFPQRVNYEERYHNLCSAIDLFLSNREDAELRGLSSKSQEINSNFLQLAAKVSHAREERAAGIRMTAELRQYVTKTFMDRALDSMEMLQHD